MNEYMAGAFFVLTPDPRAFRAMLRALRAAWAPTERFGYNGNGGGGYAYGEQDFFNDFWRGAGAADNADNDDDGNRDKGSPSSSTSSSST